MEASWLANQFVMSGRTVLEDRHHTSHAQVSGMQIIIGNAM
jgi:hypothetical protein